MGFILHKTDYLVDLKCPYCGAGYDIEWLTEYGDPEAGTDATECLDCEGTFRFSTTIVYNTWRTSPTTH